jgi:hypothetical protein
LHLESPMAVGRRVGMGVCVDFGESVSLSPRSGVGLIVTVNCTTEGSKRERQPLCMRSKPMSKAI